MNNVLLTSTLHDPDGSLFNDLQEAARVVSSHYAGWVVSATLTTKKIVKDKLRELGVHVVEADPKTQIVPDGIENEHLNALREAVDFAQKKGIERIQYTDGDRIIVAANYFPGDLGRMAAQAQMFVEEKNSYLNFRRSPEDYFTHDPPLVQTELEFNRLYSLVFGIPIDIGSTAHGMSIDVAKYILDRSKETETVSFPHPKWLLFARELGAKIDSLETKNVLTFETPEQQREKINEEVKKGEFQKVKEVNTVIEIQDALDKKQIFAQEVKRSSLTPEDVRKNYGLKQQVYMQTLGRERTLSKEEWERRFFLAGQYIRLLGNHLDVFGFDQKREEDYRVEISRSLANLDGRRMAILEALKITSIGSKKERI